MMPDFLPLPSRKHAQLARSFGEKPRQALPKEPKPAPPPKPISERQRRKDRRAELADRAVQQALEDNISPLDVILKRMRTPEEVSPESFEAACAAAPFLHPKLSAVMQVTAPNPADDQIDLTGLTDEELRVMRKALMRGSAAGAITIDQDSDAEAGGDA